MTVKHFPNDSALSCKIAKFYIHEFYLDRGFKSAMLSNNPYAEYVTVSIFKTEYMQYELC